MKKSLPKYVYPKGRMGYLYFTRRGKTTRMYERPGTPEFALEYARLIAEIPTAPRSHTLTALIKSYKASEEFLSKKPRTQSDYEKILNYLDSVIGDRDPRNIKRKHVIRIRDANKDRVRFANYCTQVLSILMNHAVDIGWRELNPAHGVKHLKTKREPRQPWPKDMIEAFREAAPIGTRARLIFELCLGTGQRIGDVLEMRWQQLAPDWSIQIRQGKTGTPLTIPVTRHLEDVLMATDPTGLYLVSRGKHGERLSYRQASHAIMEVRKAIGAEAYDIHALRHTAASELAEAGCSDELIMAITGHKSAQMVRLYAGEARQIARAKEAQEKRK